jgi:hypothetical protein
MKQTAAKFPGVSLFFIIEAKNKEPLPIDAGGAHRLELENQLLKLESQSESEDSGIQHLIGLS